MILLWNFLPLPWCGDDGVFVDTDLIYAFMCSSIWTYVSKSAVHILLLQLHPVTQLLGAGRVLCIESDVVWPLLTLSWRDDILCQFGHVNVGLILHTFLMPTPFLIHVQWFLCSLLRDWSYCTMKSWLWISSRFDQDFPWANCTVRLRPDYPLINLVINQVSASRRPYKTWFHTRQKKFITKKSIGHPGLLEGGFVVKMWTTPMIYCQHLSSIHRRMMGNRCWGNRA